MTYDGLLRLGGVEIANAQRCATYMNAGVKAPTTSVDVDNSWRYTHRYLSQDAYRLPALDLAPWYSASEPDSKDFAGIWPMSTEGLTGAVVKREAIDGINDGATFASPRYGAREVQVEALLIGATPAAVDYGMRWLTTALRGDRCRNPHAGQTLQYLATAPEVADNLSTDAFRDCVRPHERTLYEVVCTEFPVITERFGRVPGLPGSCGYRVKFTLTAGVPFAFRPPQLVASGVAWGGSVSPITWQINGTDPDLCATTTSDVLVDPQAPVQRVIRPSDAYQLGTLIPLDSKTATVTVPSSLLKPAQGDAALQVTVRAGAKEERLIRVRIGRKPTGATDTTAITCNLVSEATINYMPAGSVLTLDGVTGRVWVTDSTGAVRDAMPVVSGRFGAPWRPPILPCGDSYVVVAEAPGDVSAAASIDVYSTVRET